jgi:hypothetical protein
LNLAVFFRQNNGNQEENEYIGITSKTNTRFQQERQKSREAVVGSMEREIQRSIEVGAEE